MNPLSENARESLELQADAIRARLLVRVGELDRRRHEVMDLKAEITRKLPLYGAIVAGSALLVGVAAGVGWAVWRASHRKTMMRQRFEAFYRAWEKPRRIAAKPRLSVLGEVGRRVLNTLAGVVVKQLLAREIKRLETRDEEVVAPLDRRLPATV